MAKGSDPPITQSLGRYFLTDRIRPAVDWGATPQNLGITPPPVQKPTPAGAEMIPLPQKEAWRIPPCNLIDAIAERESRRRFRNSLHLPR